jgi:hypothetical protein
MEAGTHAQFRDVTRAGWLAVWRRAIRAGAYGMLSDAALVLRAQAGDHAAFDALFGRYRNRIYAMAFGSLGNEGLALDTLCETALAAFRDIGSYRAPCTPGTWLYIHGFRVVFERMGVAPGRYTVDRRLAAESTPRVLAPFSRLPLTER